MIDLLKTFFRNEIIILRGAGALASDKWTEARSGSDPKVKAIFEQWILGYLSGAALFTNKNIIKNTSENAIFEEMDRRCKLKPLAMIVDAASDIAKELAK